MSLGHFLDVYNGLARCSPVLHYIGKTGFFVFVMLGKKGRDPSSPPRSYFVAAPIKTPRVRSRRQQHQAGQGQGYRGNGEEGEGEEGMRERG